MEAFHELKVNCPYEILEIRDIKISNKPNEHGHLYLKVLVDENVNFKYAIEASISENPNFIFGYLNLLSERMWVELPFRYVFMKKQKIKKKTLYLMEQYKT